MNANRELEAQDLTRRLDASTRLILSAHDADVRQATDSVVWERRGWLGRLVRSERPPAADRASV